MVWPKFSEFSYGFALTSEIISRSKADLTKAPQFPNLREEASKGYDLKLDWPLRTLMLQFKRPEALTRRSAKELKFPYNLEKFLSPIFYRMHLMSSAESAQHEHLVTHDSNGYDVYYAAPSFHEEKDFDRYYDQSTIIDHSAFFRPSAIGLLPDDDRHHVAFQPGGTVAYRCSTVTEIEAPLSGERAVEKLIGRESVAGRQSMRLQLPTAYRHLYDIAENARKDQAIRVGLGPVLLDGEDALLVPSSVARWEAKLPPRDPDITEMPAALAEIARRVLDCQVVFMQVEPKAEQE